MIRLARRASMPVAFYLLISAATASAECAWVLWEYSLSSVREAWSPDFAAQSQNACQAKIVEYIKNWRTHMRDKDLEESEVIRVNPASLTYRLKATGSEVFVKYTCLPDTLDPRGPKGK